MKLDYRKFDDGAIIVYTPSSEKYLKILPNLNKIEIYGKYHLTELLNIQEQLELLGVKAFVARTAPADDLDKLFIFTIVGDWDIERIETVVGGFLNHPNYLTVRIIGISEICKDDRFYVDNYRAYPSADMSVTLKFDGALYISADYPAFIEGKEKITFYLTSEFGLSSYTLTNWRKEGHLCRYHVIPLFRR